MIPVSEAIATINANRIVLPSTQVALSEAVGQVLREPIQADRDFPPFNRVTMDGIAIRYDSYWSGEDTFRIEGVQLAGALPQTLKQADACLEVMTGAMLPKQTDTVIRYEDLEIIERRGIRYAHIFEAPKMRWQNVHQQGSDRRVSDLLMPEGAVLSPAEIAVAATVGKTTLSVTEPPQIAIISTGDELVEITETPLPHQIRKSNSYMLQAALRQENIRAEIFHLPDDKATLRTELSRLLARFEVLVVSGGVSKGQADFIPEVLQDLGVQKLFHEVAQRPGKPFWFGRIPQGPVVFALPGNPVSTFVCYYKYVQPWVQGNLGKTVSLPLKAILQQEVAFKPNLTYFLPVKMMVNDRGAFLAEPLRISGSGDFAALMAADGFLELPPHSTVFPAGEAFPYIGFRRQFAG